MPTTRLVDLVSSQTTGRASVAIRSSIGAASSASRGARCSPIRLGASSPSTRLTKVMHAVTMRNDSVAAQPESTFCLISHALRKPASVSAPNAPETSVAKVTPICTAEKNRFGSLASRAVRWPRLPRLARALTWPSRSDTRAISDAEKNPPMHTMTRTMMMSRITLLIFSAWQEMCGASVDRIAYESREHAMCGRRAAGGPTDGRRRGDRRGRPRQREGL